MCAFDFDDEDFEFDNEEFQTFGNENKQLNDELVEACGKKGILPMKAQEGINRGVLGMTATAYKKLHGIPEPINDNLPERTLRIKNVGIVLTTDALESDERSSISNKEAKEIGLKNGIMASLIFEDKNIQSQLKAGVAKRLAEI